MNYQTDYPQLRRTVHRQDFGANFYNGATVVDILNRLNPAQKATHLKKVKSGNKLNVQ